ncbi:MULTISPECIES: DUF2121 family protein [Methanothermobacter]|uniref:DUF2121 domain-containing protein n=1 Tax=Methanothermobacter marburgensis (strain ATCC BAA-927 / DSM 2133 / JCM 14651 / NBRC 100331 / OCM 82 / Marburg) TaxID=79929 RepID=D9PWZ2_METTM|nr:MULTISPECIES: DUF2121 family protein [Methanothermobacter]ADL58740.1 conserved hypothetical protein [Methanothermobacter marburgensis str. Marburg]QEF95056.1 DUF2121 domain-containing protein [Methanothermobacter sp. KEPCO-1]QHN07449.1 DUF2121 domain-containing protein [Methanothermobacter sp. THM-2]WBF09305.1 DUF2121 family protein [Methanothermobacter marburgensis]
MSLIITYISTRGCVIAGDKRRIAYFGDKSKREKLEEELYSGKIKSDDELHRRASELGVSIKVTDDTAKVRSLGDVVVGEISQKTPFETKRRRIYATTGAYQIIDLTGSRITSMEKGETAIIVFGNKVAKELTNRFLKKRWKTKTTLKEVENLFRELMDYVSSRTPSVGSKYDIFMKSPSLDKRSAHKLLSDTIVRDVRLLQKWRAKLKQEMLDRREEMKLASRILTEGEVGRVISQDGNHVEVKLSDGVEAYDTRWKRVAGPGENVLMRLSDDVAVAAGEGVAVRNENLCVDGRDIKLECDVIICRTEE